MIVRFSPSAHGPHHVGGTPQRGRTMRRALVVLTLAFAPVIALAAPAAAHHPACVEDVNPHGQNVPPAGSTTLPGPNGGQNEDGFYKISSDTGVQVFVVDQGSGTVFGPYPSGSTIKYTQAPGSTPSEKKIGSDNGQAGAVITHI